MVFPTQLPSLAVTTNQGREDSLQVRYRLRIYHRTSVARSSVTIMAARPSSECRVWKSAAAELSGLKHWTRAFFPRLQNYSVVPRLFQSASLGLKR